jgi:PPP family 3-phenylpropionic acid transporter
MTIKELIIRQVDSHLTLKFSILQLTFWSTWCSFFSFAGMYFTSKGLSYTFVGLAMSVAVMSGVFGQIFWGYISDKTRSMQKVFMLANIIIWVLVMIFSIRIIPAFTILLMALLGFCQIPQVAVLDSWIMRKSSVQHLNYGFIRMWASLGFSFFAWVIGILIDETGFIIMFVFTTILVICTLVVSLLTADPPIRQEKKQKISLKKSYVKLFLNKKYSVFLVGCFLAGFGTQAADNLLPLIVSNVGGTASDLGMVIFLSAITEVPIFMLSIKIFQHFSNKKCFVLSFSIYILQYIILMIAKSPLAVAIGMSLQGIGFAIFLPNIRKFANNNSPHELRTSAQTMTDAVNTGLAGTIASFFGALVIENFSVAVMFGICIVLTSTAMIIMLIINSPQKKL